MLSSQHNQNHAFGNGKLTWDDALVDGRVVLSTISEALGWLREGQERLRQSIVALDDAELLRPRMTNWGELKETLYWLHGISVRKRAS